MKFRFTIGRRIGIGFATFILLTTVAFVLTIMTIFDSKSRTEEVVNQVSPSVTELKELNLLLQRSHTDISKWYYNKSFNDVQFREELKSIISTQYPKKREILNNYAERWSASEKEELKIIFSRIEHLFSVYQGEIMDQLNSAEAYEDPNIYMIARLPFEDAEISISTIYKSLNQLIENKKSHANSEVSQMFSSLDFLKNFVQWLGIALVIGGYLLPSLQRIQSPNLFRCLKKCSCQWG